MLWMNTGDKDGYGHFRAAGRLRKAHRISYELAYGPIPAGLEIDHVHAKGCRHRNCIAPLHLEAVTHAENQRRGGAAKTRCINGHEYTVANTYRTPRGARNCRACRRQALRNLRERRRQAA